MTTVVAMVQLPRLYKYYIFLGAGLMLVSMYRYVRQPRTSRLALMAVGAAIAGLYRPDQGAYGFLAAVAAVLIVERSVVRALVVLPGMIIAAASPWLVFLIARGGVRKYIADESFARRTTRLGSICRFRD